VTNLMVGGVSKPVSFQSYGPGKLVLKITNIGYSGLEAQGLEVSFDLVNGSACPTIDTFLAQTTYSIMNNFDEASAKCCPTFSFPA
jgi:hypothetical protein